MSFKNFQIVQNLVFILSGLSLLVIFLRFTVFVPPAFAQETTHILGRVVRNDPTWQCKEDFPGVSRYFYGNFHEEGCDPSYCDGHSNYTIEWSQPAHGRSGTLRGNNCFSGQPRYTSEFSVNEPFADEDGEDITISITMDDPNVKLNHWFRSTSYGNGVTCEQTLYQDFAIPGPVQTITTKIFKKDSGCNWNHIWFIAYPAPTNLERVCLPNSKAKFSWTPVPQIAQYKLKIDYDPETNKKGPNYQEICFQVDPPSGGEPPVSYIADIIPNTTYFGWGVSAAGGDRCSNPYEEGGVAEDFQCRTPSCTISIENTTIPLSSTTMIFPLVGEYNGTVDKVTFQITDPNIVSVCNSTLRSCPPGNGTYIDVNPRFDANLTGYEFGTTTLTVTGEMSDEFGGPITCTDSAQVTVINPSSWWQVIGGDAVAGQNDLVSRIPFLCPNCSFIKDNPIGHPGVPSAGGKTDFGGRDPSSQRWDVDFSPYLGENIDYAFFERKIPQEVLTNPNFRFSETLIDGVWLKDKLGNYPVEYPGGSGYYWLMFRPTGFQTNLTIKGTEITPSILGNRRLVLFVDGNLNISTRINTTAGTSGFYAIVRGNLNIDPNVGEPAPNTSPDIEGIFYAGGTFSTGTLGANKDKQLYIRGSAVANDFELQRDLANNTLFPGEVFKFGPDLLLGWPPFLSAKNIIWKEISP